MPRRNRTTPEPQDERPLGGGSTRHTEERRGRTFTVQAVPASRALKPYVCPGCSTVIEPDTAHLVIWRSDGVLGDEADLAARRHWHVHCWRIA